MIISRKCIDTKWWLKKTKPTRSTYLKRTVNSSCSKFLVIVKVIKMISVIIDNIDNIEAVRQRKMVVPWISLRNMKKLKETKPKQQRQI